MSFCIFNQHWFQAGRTMNAATSPMLSRWAQSVPTLLTMEKLTFQLLNSLCHFNIGKKYVDDCLQILNNEDCIFDSGVVMPRDHIASLYSLRFEIAREGGKLTEDYQMDYANCVEKLNNSEAAFLGITWVYGMYKSFIIFYEPDRKIILGILKALNIVDIKSIEENITGTVNKGFSSSAEKYSKGTYVKSWK